MKDRYPFRLKSGALRRFLPAVLLAPLGLAGASAEADTIHVPADAPTIQVAINVASGGDEIIVAPGAYFESIDLLGKTLTIRSSGGPDVTTIDAVGQFTHAITIASGEGGATLIDGFTIRNGEAVGGSFPDNVGGAVYVNGASPTIRNCIITECTAVVGGGMFAGVGSNPTLENCTFVENVATDSGGSAYFLGESSTLIDCVFENNVATFNAGALLVSVGTNVFTRCRFMGNSSVISGGAIRLAGAAQLTVNDGWFENNFSGDGGSNGRGGAIHVDGSTPSATITNTVFFNNSCTRFGGALYAADPLLARNCTFYGNVTGSGSEGVMGQFSGALENCTAWNNGSSPVQAATSVQYSNIQGGFAGPGNIGGDPGDEPLFMDAANGDFRLLDGSPGIDAGNSTLLPGAVDEDFGGQPRVVNGLESGASGVPVFGYYVDMGAFEFQPEGAGGDPSCPADLNGDGSVGEQVV